MLRVGVVADTHGDISIFEEVIKKMGPIDIYIHLGDFVSDAKKVFDDLGVQYIVVKGNCDFLEEAEREAVVDIAGKKFFISHGHQYNVKYGYNDIYYRALEEEADIVLFGHTHMPVSLWYKGILFFNPGSTLYPKGSSEASYGIIEIMDDEICPEIHQV